MAGPSRIARRWISTPNSLLVARQFRNYGQVPESQTTKPSGQQTFNDIVQTPKEAHGIRSRPPPKDPPVLLIGSLLLLAIPPLVYYYWQYREEHMKAKKYAILKELQARAANKA